MESEPLLASSEPTYVKAAPSPAAVDRATAHIFTTTFAYPQSDSPKIANALVVWFGLVWSVVPPELSREAHLKFIVIHFGPTKKK